MRRRRKRSSLAGRTRTKPTTLLGAPATSPGARAGRERLLAVQAASRGQCSVAKQHVARLRKAPASVYNDEVIELVEDRCGSLSGTRTRRRRRRR